MYWSSCMLWEYHMTPGSRGFRSLLAFAIVAAAALGTSLIRTARKKRIDARTTAADKARWENEGGSPPSKQ